MTTINIKHFFRISSAVAAMILLCATFAAAGSNRNAVNVAVANGDFEDPKLQPNAWTHYVPGWQPVDSTSMAGVWRPKNELSHRDYERKNTLYINQGGVSQALPVAVQGGMDYSVTLEWEHRLDVMMGSLAVQLVAGDQVLASCAPPYGPDADKAATVTLTYHSDATNAANGQPLSVRILKLNRAIPTPIVNAGWGTQLDVDDVQVTATNHVGPPALHASECSVSVAQGDPAAPTPLVPASSQATAVAVMNPSFEIPSLAPGIWTNDVPAGWAAFDGSLAGIWYPTIQFSSNAAIDGKEILYINSGGVSQELPVRLQALAEYSFSVNWGHRLDMMNGALALQLVAGDQVLATCAPPASPDPGTFVKVNLTYYSDGSSSAIGQPVSIQIVKQTQDLPTLVVNPDWGTQLDVDNVQVTFSSLSGTPSSAITNAQECSTTIFGQ